MPRSQGARKNFEQHLSGSKVSNPLSVSSSDRGSGGILLDTHVLLWWLAGEPTLPRWMRERIADPEVQCLVSAATIWEIGIKRAIGKLDAPPGLISIIAEEGFRHLHITPDHAQTAAALPLLHRDPFDRMLIGQALVESLTIATLDPAFADYPARLLAR